MRDKVEIPCIMTIFGGTGDLTHRKLVPALYNLAQQDLLSKDFAVVGIGRQTMSHDEYRHKLLISTEKFSRFQIKHEIWERLAKKIYYYQLDFSNSTGYFSLKTFLAGIDERHNTKGNRLFYLSVAPEYFAVIPFNLKNNSLVTNSGSWQRLVIEKPFGRDLLTAQHLNNAITEVFPENKIFRIDHYLGKEMVQNILVIRFGNSMFESIWNSRYITNIQITSSETVGVESRSGYYESLGALRDMMQNHMLQLLALTAMEPPAKIDAESIRSEKVKLLRSLDEIAPENIIDRVIRGQYGRGIVDNKPVAGYREEKGVRGSSTTETYAAMRLNACNFRWGSMPFYLRTGKRLAKKVTNIIIEFESLPEILYFKEFKGMQPNILEIRIQPKEGMSFQLNAKTPGTMDEISKVKMDFCQNCEFEDNSPEAYERLIADALRNDQTLFTSWDEIEASWSFINNITKFWENSQAPQFPNYPAGTWGPAEADNLLAKDGHKWRN